MTPEMLDHLHRLARREWARDHGGIAQQAIQLSY
jgi:hypothetical protein